MDGKLTYRARHEDDTHRLGKAVARALPAGTVVGLCGTLGSGKTRLAQAISVACGVPPTTVVSPTFTLCNEYAGQRKINHLDLYRIQDSDELIELGFEEYLQSEGLTLIEWADRFPEMMPLSCLEIVIEVIDDRQRDFHLTSNSSELTSALAEISASLNG